MLLTFVSKNEASDLHLKVGYAPYVRIGGQLRKIESPVLPDSNYIEQMMAVLIPPHSVPSTSSGEVWTLRR